MEKEEEDLQRERPGSVVTDSEDQGTGVGEERAFWVGPQDGTEELGGSPGTIKVINIERSVDASPPA